MTTDQFNFINSKVNEIKTLTKIYDSLRSKNLLGVKIITSDDKNVTVNVSTKPDGNTPIAFLNMALGLKEHIEHLQSWVTNAIESNGGVRTIFFSEEELIYLSGLVEFSLSEALKDWQNPSEIVPEEFGIRYFDIFPEGQKDPKFIRLLNGGYIIKNKFNHLTTGFLISDKGIVCLKEDLKFYIATYKRP